MKKKYQVLQGILTESGNGDLLPVPQIGSDWMDLDEALLNADRICQDFRGWRMSKKTDVLVTIVTDEDGEYYYYSEAQRL